MLGKVIVPRLGLPVKAGVINSDALDEADEVVVHSDTRLGVKHGRMMPEP